MSELDRGIALARTSAGRYDAEVDPGWFVLTGANGGYVAALLVRAIEATVAEASDVPAQPKPLRSLSVQYLQPAAEGPAQVEVDITRVGRSLTFVDVRLRQGGKLAAHGLAALGSGRGAAGFQDGRPPEGTALPDALPPPPPPPPGVPVPPIAHRLDYRPVAQKPLFSGAPAEFWCWLRLVDRPPVDAAMLAVYADAMFPALFFRSTIPVVVPTVDLTVHLRTPPRPGYDGWCLGHVRTSAVADGFAEEDCEIYDDAGMLLAQSRQLGLVVPLG
ncbi:MAG TPA: thioesterase family protein [Mycobacteriales bacterium]|nr:thioesterase family protein [Mycobacteriales bacterium]